MNIDQPLLSRQVATDFVSFINVIKQAKAYNLCRFTMLWSHHRLMISFSEKWVVSLLIKHPMNNVEQDDCGSATEDKNCAETSNMVEL